MFDPFQSTKFIKLLKGEYLSLNVQSHNCQSYVQVLGAVIKMTSDKHLIHNNTDSACHQSSRNIQRQCRVLVYNMCKIEGGRYNTRPVLKLTNPQ